MLSIRPMRIIQITTYLLAAAITAFAGELKFDQTKPRSARFIARTQIETFVGKTDQIDGCVSWNGDDMLSGSKFQFEVDLASLDTGIKLRNRHMRKKHLETDKFPSAQYSGKLVRLEEKGPNELLVAAEGKMTIHGIERNLAIEAIVTIENDSYYVQCEIRLKLTDFEIKVPRFMLLKMDDNVKLVLDFYMKPAESGEILGES